MNILAIETSSTACSAALLIGDTIISHHEIVPLQQAKIVLPVINELLQSSHVKLEQLNAIAFGCGPGSFTGIRIATSVAQGLGLGAKLPLIPISSLAALAQAAFGNLGWQKLLVAIDARVNEIYWGIFEVEQGIVQLKNKEYVSPPNKVDLPDTNEWYGVGNGWELYRDSIAFNPIKIDTSCLPTAAAVARLAEIKYQNGKLVSPSEAQPVYLRDRLTTPSK